jgi:DNA-binding transcriptional MerR regulator
MRSGAAARFVGISASTLRIWEYRYGIVVLPQTAAGHRTYSMKDVERLRIIKRLTSEGHAISTLAHLDVNALNTLPSKSHTPSITALRIFAVGNAAARKLKGRLQSGTTLVFDDMSAAEKDAASVGAVDVLVVHIRTLHADLADRILRLRSTLSVSNTVVLYSFGVETVPELLRAAGITVRREPLSGRELLTLCIAAPQIFDPPGSHAKPYARRYSDADLITLSEIESKIFCECPRHLAEIVTLLVGFAQYSTECAMQNQKDATLHAYLQEVTAQSRAILEQALERVVIQERLSHLLSS